MLMAAAFHEYAQPRFESQLLHSFFQLGLHLLKGKSPADEAAFLQHPKHTLDALRRDHVQCHRRGMKAARLNFPLPAKIIRAYDYGMSLVSENLLGGCQ